MSAATRSLANHSRHRSDCCPGTRHRLDCRSTGTCPLPFLALKVSTFNHIDSKSFGFAVFDSQIILVHGVLFISNFLSHYMCTSALTLYEKSAGKGARRAWASEATLIGALSYIAVECYEHIQSRQSSYWFCPMGRECVVARTHVSIFSLPLRSYA